jgi:signal transduction histidine kinase/HPt (histidine-containing phosphotransfer) domain-containing protein/ActR/RegA family two-component response regulator
VTVLSHIARWQGRQWAVALSVLLVLTLSPLGWIQWRQFQMLDGLSRNQVDSIMWQAYQLERELGRLKQSVLEARNPDTPVGAEVLARRYEMLLSRVDLLTRIPRRDLLESSFEYQSTVSLIQAFVALADPLFAVPQRLVDSPEQLQRVSEQIDQLELPLAELTREANRAVSRFVDERNRQLRQQSLLVIALATVQILAMLLFVGLLVRHIRRQQAQFDRLQVLSRELAGARDQAEAANRGKSIFLANMSHEIRTPFQGLLGMLNLLDEPNLSGQQRDYLQTARDSALHLLGVLNDILDVSTMESGTLKLTQTPVHLRSVIEEVGSLMQVAARDKGLELRVEAASDLPEWVVADATRVRQIMFNLINNAIKFTPAGRVLAQWARPADGQPGVVLTVRDTGVGMSAETLDRLFTRFYQAANSPRRRIGGTGLGLEISRNLARMMGGDIQVSSQPGMGSVFTVRLQLPETTAPGDAGFAPPEAGSSRRLRVLVAEDHPINLKYMSILLEKMGHEAVFCEDGQEALQLLAMQHFDVVLLDYHMPVLDGLATTEAIRQLEGAAAGIPVILVTADVVNDTRQRALEVGVNGFASKPLQASDLQRVLQRCGLLDDAGPASVPAAGLERSTSPFPVSSYEMPIRLPDPEIQAGDVIDSEAYTEILSMMPQDAMDEMLDTLFAPPDGTLQVLLKALADGDRTAIGHQAHKLKGTAMLLGFRLIVKTSAQIEQQAAQENATFGKTTQIQLLRDMEQTQQALRYFVRRA